MNKSKFLKWGVFTPLSVIGALAIVSLVVVLSFGAIQSLKQSTGNYGGVMSMSSSDGFFEPEMAYDTAIERSESISFMAPEMLADEALAAEIDQKIIKTGSLTVVVDDADESSATVQEIAEKAGGYVSSVSLRELTDGSRSGSVQIRVPADQFDTVLNEIKDAALVVERETVSTEDVTEEYIDVSARLSNSQAQEDRYVEILEIATTVEEIMQIEEALSWVRSDIESYQGRIDYLDSQTGFSTITVSLSEEPVIVIGGKEFRPGTTIKEAALAFVALVQWSINAAIWIIIVGGGLLIPLALLAWVARKIIIKLKK